MEKVIVIEHLRKTYKDKLAVADVSFEVKKGEVFGIVGPNGAGKTTTLEIMEGLRKRDSGKVEVLGLDPGKSKRSLQEKIGVQFQLTALQDRLKVKEALDVFAAFYSKKINLSETIDFFGLKPYLSHDMKKLSGGWRQRVSLALAVIHDPEIVFLDEPSTGLDPAARHDVWTLIESLKAKGKTIVLTTHYMEEAERLCDRIAMFKQGEIAFLDQPASLLQQFSSHRYLKLHSRELRAEVFDGIKEISNAREVQSGEWHIEGDDLQSITLMILTRCQELNFSIDHLEFVMSRLDDLFIRLIGNTKEQSA